MIEVDLWADESLSDFEKEFQTKSETGLLARYMEIYSQTLYEMRKEGLDGEGVKRGFATLANFNFPVENFQAIKSFSKASIISIASDVNSIEPLYSYFHAADLIFGSKPDGHSILNYILKASFEKSRKSLWLPLDEIEKMERLYLFKQSSVDFCSLLNDYFSSNEDWQFTVDEVDCGLIHVTSLFLLSQHYGEIELSEILNRSLEEEKFFSAIEIESLLKDWANMKDYPLEWSMTILKRGKEKTNE